MAKFNPIKDLPLLISVGSEIVALVNTIKRVAKDGELSDFERQLVVTDVRNLLKKLGLKADLDL